MWKDSINASKDLKRKCGRNVESLIRKKRVKQNTKEYLLTLTLDVVLMLLPGLFRPGFLVQHRIEHFQLLLQFHRLVTFQIVGCVSGRNWRIKSQGEGTGSTSAIEKKSSQKQTKLAISHTGSKSQVKNSLVLYGDNGLNRKKVIG